MKITAPNGRLSSTSKPTPLVEQCGPAKAECLWSPTPNRKYRAGSTPAHGPGTVEERMRAFMGAKKPTRASTSAKASYRIDRAIFVTSFCS